MSKTKGRDHLLTTVLLNSLNLTDNITYKTYQVIHRAKRYLEGRGGGEVEPLSVPMRGRGERLKRFRFRVWHLSKGSTCSAIQLTSLFIVIKNVTKFSRKLEFHYFLQVLKMARKSSLISVI